MLGSPIEEIKNKLDVVQLVGEYVKLQKAGANWRALCPFHQEKGPSFFVSPARQMFHCFGCGLGGDIFKFVQEIEGVEFGDALRLLAAKAGVELRPRDPSYQKLQSERKRLYELTELALKFFEKQLVSSKAGQDALAYLKNRGIENHTLSAWRIGYAPDSLRSLLDFLLSRGFREYEIANAGLLVRSDSGTLDRFRSRIIFPVFDVQSQVIGFGGRIFGKENKELAKYVNVPSTPLYDKSRVLYGLDKAKIAVRKQDSCILVEGYMDAILAWQAGSENVVATSGTALTPLHLQLLKRYSENLVLAFDMDVAGDSATKRGIDLALERGFQVRVLQMPKDKDPADVAGENKETWLSILSSPFSILEYYFSSAFAKTDKTTAQGKKEIGVLLLPVIKKIPNAIEQSYWVQRLAQELDIKEEIVRQELDKVAQEKNFSPKNAANPTAQVEQIPKARKELLQERILILLFQNPQNMAELKQYNKAQFSLQTQEILAGLEKQPDLNFSLLQDVFSKDVMERLEYIAMQAEMLESLESGIEENVQEFLLCLKSYSLVCLKERLDGIAREIKKAEQEQNQEKVQVLLQEFHTISKELSAS